MRHEGKVYPTYGALNEQTNKSENMCYRVIWSNVVLGILLSETFVAPLYFVGFHLYEPYAVKPEKGCGIDSQ